MCGRYQLDVDKRQFKARFNHSPTFKSNWNVAPTQEMPVITTEDYELQKMKWGIVPFWEEKKEKPHELINVRDDSIIEKAWAKRYITAQRCLIPASGFFEWKREADHKVPFFIHLTDEQYFCFAGIYDKGRYAIITTTPNTLMSHIHNRMPVILKRKEERQWINPDIVEIVHIHNLLKPYPTEKMEAYEISSRVNSPKHNDTEISKPLEQ